MNEGSKRLYQQFEVDEETPVQYAAVYITRWRPEWGEPTALFAEVDGATQQVIDAAPAMLDALVHAEQTIRNLATSGALEGDSKTIALNEAQNLRDEIARAKGETE